MPDVQLSRMTTFRTGSGPDKRSHRHRSGNAQVFVGLQAQLPLRMGQAIADRLGCVVLPLRPVHGLEQQPRDPQPFIVFGWSTLLRKDQLQLVGPVEDDRRPRLRADTDPIQARWGRPGSVGLDGDGKAAVVESLDRGAVELKERLTAGAHHIGAGVGVRLPAPCGR